MANGSAPMVTITLPAVKLLVPVNGLYSLTPPANAVVAKPAQPEPVVEHSPASIAPAWPPESQPAAPQAAPLTNLYMPPTAPAASATAAYAPPVSPAAALPAAQAPAMLPEPALQYATPSVPTSSPTLQSMAPVMPSPMPAPMSMQTVPRNLADPLRRYVVQSAHDDRGGAASCADMATAVGGAGRQPGSRPVGALYPADAPWTGAEQWSDNAQRPESVFPITSNPS